MAKDKDLLERFGANLAESMGAGRPKRMSGPGATPAAARSSSEAGG